jgi:hypothetical protein
MRAGGGGLPRPGAGAGDAAAIHFRETPPTQPTAVRFQVPRPRAALRLLPFMALSPDGRRFRFSATGKGGGQPLLGSARSIPWKRAPCLAQRVPLFLLVAGQPLPGVFGRWQAEEDRGIRGPPQTLCSVSTNTATAGYWNRDGVIFFSGGPMVLLRVPQAGGDPVRGPGPIPPGETVTSFRTSCRTDVTTSYLIQFAARENSAIYLGSPDGNQKKRLVGTSYGFATCRHQTTARWATCSSCGETP